MPDELTIETERPAETTAVVVLSGELELANCARLRETTVGLLGEGVTQLIIDLTALSFVDSSGVGVVIGSLKRTKERQGAFAVVCSNPSILRLFEITGLTEVFSLYSTQEEALTALREETVS